MTPNQMRIELARFYGQQWFKKVEKFPDAQIVAIYKSFQKRKKIK